MIYLDTPTSLRFDESYSTKEKLLATHLQYIDKKVDYEIKRLKNSAHWYVKDEESQKAYEEQIAALKASRKKSLLFDDGVGGYWTYSGLAGSMSQKFGDNVDVRYTLPESQSIPYATTPKHEPRKYQVEACDALVGSAMYGPRRVEIGTGLGKSTIIRMVIKKLGLKTVVMAPSTNIAGQLFDDLSLHFGKRYVGMFGGGKKVSDKLITVGIDDSLTKVEQGTEHWNNLSKADVFIADESHLCPADTLAKVCLGLCAKAPYRFFFSGTQIRNDGLDLLLDGITGETVYDMTVRQGVDQGFLARPHFRMVKMTSDTNCYSSDPNKLTRAHLYYNPKVNKHAAMLANMFVSKMKRPTVILVEELEQFAHLLPFLKNDVSFAHGPLTNATRKLVPKEYHNSDPSELVERFNQGKIPILVGTSSIATGTDIRSVGAMIYLMGKSSEIKVKQAVGRDTRGGKYSDVFNPWTGEQKLECIHVDYNIINVDVVSRHANIRRGFYEDIYGPVEIIEAV